MKLPVKFHKRFNDVLTIVVLALAAYLVFSPFLPNAHYYARQVAARPKQLTVNEDKPEAIGATPRLAISRLEFDQEIHEGTSLSTLNKGIWRRPNSSTPARGGNTVIVGHRFYNSRPAIFYHLDKVKVGDTITVDWDHARYYYQVSRVLVVSPSTGSIEADTSDPLLTLYTCTPLWSAAQRLVIQANLVRTTP